MGQPSRRAAPSALRNDAARDRGPVFGRRGVTVKETARKSDIPLKTADHHIQSAYGKIGVTTRAAAALYAVEHGVLKAGEAPA